MALAPFLLAYLYRCCGNLSHQPLGSSGGPQRVLQLWLYNYFPMIAPEPVLTDVRTYGEPFLPVSPPGILFPLLKPFLSSLPLI